MAAALTNSDLHALRVGDMVRLHGHHPRRDGRWHEVDRVYPVERVRVTISGHRVCFDAHLVGSPNIRTSGELRDGWTYGNGADWPGSPRECVVLAAAPDVAIAAE